MALRGTSSTANIASQPALKLGLAANLTRRALREIGNKVAPVAEDPLAKHTANIASQPALKLGLAPNLTRRALREIGNKVAPVAEDPLAKHVKGCVTTCSHASNKPAGFSTQLLDIEDIDKDDQDNPQLVNELVNDNYEYMRSLENEYLIRPHYLQGKQTNARKRRILVGWLVQVHMEFQLCQETLYLTIGIIDRFLQEHDVSKNRLQLVGVTAMFIASKYEEIYPDCPKIRDFVFITDDTYTTVEIRRMECLILKTLDFKLGRPLPLHFLRRYSKVGDANEMLNMLAEYLMELTLGEYTMVHISPSVIAAAALCFSMKILDIQSWNDTLVNYSNYAEKELVPVMKKMATLVTNTFSSKFVGVPRKYASSRFLKISCIPELRSHVLQLSND